MTDRGRESRLALRSLGAVMNKEFIHIFRDPGTLAISLVIPVFLLLLFGYALSLDVREVPVWLCDLDRSAASRALVADFTASGWFRVAGRTDSEAELRRRVDGGDCRLGLLVPAGFGRDLAAGRAPAVGALVDGSNSVTASVILAYGRQIIARRAGLAADFRPRVLFNPTASSTAFLVPGLLAVIMMFMTILLPSLAVVREKERGTIEILRAGPIRPAAFIIGKLLPYGLICVFDLLTVVVVGTFVFGVPVRGSFLLLVGASLPFLAAGLALGLLISTFVDNLQVAMYLSFITSVLPTFLLSGFVFPISSMPRLVQYLTLLLPARHYLVLVRGIYLKAAPPGALLQPLLVGALFAVVLVAAAVERLRRTL
jgi:ABC-2 type transport system permease protein